MKTQYLLLSMFLLTHFNVQAVLGPIPIYLNPVLINSNAFLGLDTNAAFASEIYTVDDINKSNANNLYDFLGQNTSIAILPSFGNPFSRLIDIRGFGLTNGYKNIVFNLNGRRLNNIDNVPQQLSIINIKNITKIEIIKGSGSVVYGDNAVAGVINITTGNNHNMFSVVKGNYGVEEYNASVSEDRDLIKVSALSSRYNQSGFSDADATGKKDKATNKHNEFTLEIRPSKTNIIFNFSKTEIDNVYVGYLNLAQFNANPFQAPLFYQNAKVNNNVFSLNLKHKVNNKIDLDIHHTDKKNTTGVFSLANSKYNTNKILLNYQQNNFKITSGIDSFKGHRYDEIPQGNTYKNNQSYFIQGNYQHHKNIYSIGYRLEKINYQYSPVAATNLFNYHKFNAYDIGINREINDKLTIFINYNQAFQAPTIDSLFVFSPYPTRTFNGFINPAEIKTLNIGLNYSTKKTKTKLTIFRSNLKNEIYLNKINSRSSFGDNTNIDESHKYGLELQYKQRLSNKLALNVNYAFIIAKIDKENAATGTYNGKSLPGVSKHSITLSADYKINTKSKINISQKYRSSSYAAEDFVNNFTQKQRAFKSTNISYHYQYSKQIKIFSKIDNLFENKNGFWLRDNVIYPTHFTRNINIGLNYLF